jgi:hypothetical protein
MRKSPDPGFRITPSHACMVNFHWPPRYLLVVPCMFQYIGNYVLERSVVS